MTKILIMFMFVKIIHLLTLKKLLFVFVIFPLYFFGQINPVNFENQGVGSVWAWTVFENEDNPILEMYDDASVKKKIIID